MESKELLIDNLDSWLECQRLDSELSDHTLNTYRNSINKFINYLSTNNLDTFDKDILIGYKKHLDLISNSVKSKNLWIISLNKYLKSLGLNNLCLKQIKVQSEFIVQSNLSVSDYNRLLRFALKENLLTDYLIIKTLTMTGVRFSELRYFTIDNLKLKNKGVIIIKSKGKVRDIEVPTLLARELRQFARENKIKEGYIFTQIKDPTKLYSANTFWKHLKKLAGLSKVGKDKCHAHSFRHLFAVEFLKTHNNALALAAILGHSSLNTTRIYTTLTTDEKRSLLDAMTF